MSRMAYVATINEKGQPILAVCEENVKGHSPVREDSDLGGVYSSEEEAQKVAKECNKRLGLTDSEASKIIVSTMSFGRKR